jgi:hypothetical protein
MAHYDSVSGNIYVTQLSQGLYALAPPYTGSLTTMGSGQTLSFHATSAIEPGQFLVYIGGSGDAGVGFQVWNLSTGTISTRTLTGDPSIEAFNAPGVQWDAKRSQFWVWNGGTSLWTVKLVSGSWVSTAYTISGSNTVTPQCTDASCTSSTGVQSNGTFGRFVRDEADDCFFIFNSIFDHAYGFKPS